MAILEELEELECLEELEGALFASCDITHGEHSTCAPPHSEDSWG